ncbi:MAG: cell division protein FtsA [Candidatus Magasanikbacteria bacterium RIFOXYD2_FULL_39_9]|uniref:Cell division protein FtsA n=1 Tax=Candidatus Magasanikbacteria bacterium RIFOXYD1_FULL_40_23 TaxID=1798705 RepID=A0A1F6P8V1_9BACT|nr:MAG: cell division protein FtsA [Candidatus Magasanikbacteria bacterium RIFOXYD2_FULL_39_9]OGH92374.1 MAG: cell division protein FtsA [Candidatus Magasanikbacteria bacterium RIFOXYD1_FULL_40_23]
MSKNQGNLISGLDIGSNFVRMVVGQVVDKENSAEELQILGAAEFPSEGVQKGVINSIEDVVSSVSACLERVERMVGVPIDSTWVGISGLHILSQNSKGVIAVSKANNEISEEDINRAVEAARSIATPLNYEVLHVLPKHYTVDGQAGIKDPTSMTGVRLEVDTQIILGSSSQIKNLTKAVYRAGIDIEDLVLSIIATAETVVTKRQKELGVMVVNFGGSTTSIAVFEEGQLIHTAIIPIGSQLVTNDIAVGLRTSVDIAERVKLEFGDCRADISSKKEEIDLFELGSPEHELVKKKYLNEIISARVEEILQKVDNELRKIQRSGLLPAGVMFTGAGAKLPGLVEMSKKVLRLPANLGYPINVVSVTDKVNDLGFATAVGLVKWGSIMHVGNGRGKPSSGGMLGGGTSKVLDHMKGWFKTLIP